MFDWKRYIRLSPLLLAALLVLLLTGSASASGKPLNVTMDWRNVVPEGSGDPNILGDAVLNLNSGKSQLCFEIRAIFFYSASTEGYAAIYSGSVGQNGPVVLDIGQLNPPFNSYTSSGCVAASSTLLKSIQQNPQGYYL